MFAFAYWQERRELTLARPDEHQTLYYAHADNALVFSSEVEFVGVN